ncbi:MAG TPA: Uma2 family endonuclease [Gemmatimonadaceae bacterium]|nr:Uma2 family endonuclease [Gemmatimonadaceae bacterium]
MAQPAWATEMLMSVEEYLVFPSPEGKAELVRGELRLTPPPGGPHGMAASNLMAFLLSHVRPHQLGVVFMDAMGYELLRLPRTVRMPDLSFVRAGRLPEAGIGPGLLKLAPDLAVEVLSPSETASELEEKLDDYLVSGTRLLWVVDPVRRTVMIISADAPVRWLREGDTLDGGAVIPGFTCAVADIFSGIARISATASA